MVDHIDRNRQNNNVNNLRWVSVEKNTHNCNPYYNKQLQYKNIVKTPYDTYQIKFVRYNNYYYKKCKTLREAIIQRDLMLSMWL